MGTYAKLTLPKPLAILNWKHIYVRPVLLETMFSVSSLSTKYKTGNWEFSYFDEAFYFGPYMANPFDSLFTTENDITFNN
jgi:hypothetical protein